MSGQPIERCDGQRFARGLNDAATWLEEQATFINALNVFPVPDGDTGTNMSLTLRAAAREAAACSDSSVGAVAKAAAHGALLGARGNSGVILSQYLRGIARQVEKSDEIGPADLAQALAQGSATAYKAVIRPVEGTILTVGRGAAQAAARAEKEHTFAAVLEAAVAGAREALERTPSLLPVLKQAGVVDAGGQGLACLLEGLLRSYRGESPVVPIPAEAAPVASGAAAPAAIENVEGDHFGYCTEFLLRAPGTDVEALRRRIVTLGDSALVVGDDDLIRVHVHTPNPGAVLEYACSVGTLHRIKIDNMQDQHEELHTGHAASMAVAATGATKPDSIDSRLNGHAPLAVDGAPSATGSAAALGVAHYTNHATHDSASEPQPAIVAVAAGDGFAELFRSVGVDVVVPGGQTMNPSTEELLRAVQSVGRSQVLLLPNNSNILMAARQVPALAGCETAIIPTRDMAQGVAAALALQPGADLETNRASMERALASVRTGEITTAVRNAHIGGLDIREGQLIGLVGGDVIIVGEDMTALAVDLLRRLEASDAELLTLYYGSGVTGAEASELRARLRTAFPNVEIEVQHGGQPLYQYLVCVE